MPIAGSSRAVMAAVAFAIGQSLAPPAAAQAGFFDFLFGPQPQAPAANPYEAHQRRVHRAHWGGALAPFGWRPGLHFHRYGHTESRPVLRPAHLTDHPARPQKPVDLMKDETLRRGDAVMTSAGVRIFVGYSADRHSPGDFRKPSEVRGLSKAERKALSALDVKGSGIGAKSDATTGRSVSQPALSVGKTVTDPNGRTIRYVGP